VTVKSGGTGILPVSSQHGQDGQATSSAAVKSGGTGILPVSAQHGQDGHATESLVARASCPCWHSMAMPRRVRPFCSSSHAWQTTRF